TQQAAAGAAAEAGAPESRRDGRIVPGIGKKVRGDPVGFDLDLAVEPLVAPELAEEALFHPGAGQAASVLEHQVSELVRQDDGQLLVAGGRRQAVVDLDDPAIRSRVEPADRPDLDKRPAAGRGA